MPTNPYTSQHTLSLKDVFQDLNLGFTLLEKPGSPLVTKCSTTSKFSNEVLCCLLYLNSSNSFRAYENFQIRK